MLQMMILTSFALVPEAFALLDMDRQFHLTIHDPPVLRAEDFEEHHWRVAEKFLPRSFGLSGGNTAPLVERHCFCRNEKMQQEMGNLSRRCYCGRQRIVVVIGILKFFVEWETLVERAAGAWRSR
jgi:hypothetical protein